jgi:hypothetical protein
MTEVTNRPPEPVRAAAPDETTKAYSTVSPLAIGGFFVAVGYSVVIAAGALVALFYRTPWVLPLWSLIFPLTAIVVCWAARSGIASSEGALTGMKLTIWGLYLSFGFGLVYAAYYAACYLSISQMATGFADEWIEDLKTDQVDKAFLLTVPPPRPNADANLRNRLELEYDRGPQGRGKFSEFRQSQMVRQFEQGDGPTVQFLGVQSWDYEAGGYKVMLAYRVTTASLISEVQVQAVGVESADEATGRQWYVKDFRPLKHTVTAEGMRLSALSDQAHLVAEKWIKKVAEWSWKDAYLDTLPRAEREAQSNHEDAYYSEGLKKFVRADPATFWAPDKEKAHIIDEVRSFFGHGGQNPDQLTLLTVPPIYKHDVETARFGFDIVFSLPPDLGVQARLLVAVDARIHEPALEDWRLEGFELLSAKTEAGPAGGPPGAPTMKPPGGP